MRQGGAAAPPTAGVAQQDPPLHLPFRGDLAGHGERLSDAAAAGGGVSHVACEKRGEGAVWKRPKAQLSWPNRPNSPSPNPPHGHGLTGSLLQSSWRPPIRAAAQTVAQTAAARHRGAPPARRRLLRPSSPLAACSLQTCHLRAAGCRATCRLQPRSRPAQPRRRRAPEPRCCGGSAPCPADLRCGARRASACLPAPGPGRGQAPAAGRPEAPRPRADEPLSDRRSDGGRGWSQRRRRADDRRWPRSRA